MMRPQEMVFDGSSSRRWRVVAVLVGMLLLLVLATSASAAGNIQISGQAFLDGSGVACDLATGYDYVFPIGGDLEGCLNVKIEDYACSPSGTYREWGTELYIITGGDLGRTGTFMTNYFVSGKWEECPPGLMTPEIFGRCQHPIITGSGTEGFEGVKGRLDFKDFPEDNFFPFRGHMKDFVNPPNNS